MLLKLSSSIIVSQTSCARDKQVVMARWAADCIAGIIFDYVFAKIILKAVTNKHVLPIGADRAQRRNPTQARARF